MRLRCVYRPNHPEANERGMVWLPYDRLHEYAPPEETQTQMAIHAPILVDRYMEGTRTVEGIDIGSRRKRREYMKQTGVADASDYKGVWARASQEREKFYTGNSDRKGRREAIERAYYNVTERRRK